MNRGSGNSWIVKEPELPLSLGFDLGWVCRRQHGKRIFDELAFFLIKAVLKVAGRNALLLEFGSLLAQVVDSGTHLPATILGQFGDLAESLANFRLLFGW